MLVARCSVSVLLFQVSWKLLPVDLEAQFDGMPASQCILHAHVGALLRNIGSTRVIYAA